MKNMVRKKTIESVEETKKPRALIINGGEVSDFLVETLQERGCEVKKVENYSPIIGRAEYVFLFDNAGIADGAFEKNLSPGGKFILVATEEIDFPFKNKFKILQIGDASFWSMPELSEKIISTLFSANTAAVSDERRKPKVAPIVPKMKKIDIESQLTPHASQVTSHIETSKKPIDVPPFVEKTRGISFKKILFIFLMFIILILVFLGSVSFWYLKKVEKTFANLNYHLKSANFSTVTADFKEIKDEVKTMRRVYGFATAILFPLKNVSSVKDLVIVFDESEKIADAGRDFTATVAEIVPSKTGFSSPGEISKEKLAALEKKAANFAAILISSQESLEKVNIPYFPKENIKTTLSPAVSKLISLYDILPVITEVFYSSSPKVYLVLFQNNMELRPTGGFIGSYGLLTISGGKILDFKIEDVYTADGQLKGHVDPPLPIRRYLSQPNFFLRDSNFDPDFAASAQQASFFLQKELGKNVDGVIGVNLTLAQKLMQVVGAIKLSDFNNEEITGDNFFYKVNYLSSANFFPGSTAKKDILTAISNEIFTSITAESGTDLLELVPIIKQAFEEKNILIYTSDPALQKIIEDHSWAGRMVKVQCVDRKDERGQQVSVNSDSCLPDYLSIIEANLGVNKANFFINKSTVVEKKITDAGEIVTTVTISYENTNNTVVLTPQTYVNYLRLFIPLGSKLVNVSINNATVATQEIDVISYENDKTSIGFLVKIAPDNRGVVKINYILPRLLSEKITSYQMFYQKQAGDKNSPLIFSLVTPAGQNLKPVNFSSTTQKMDEIFYTTDTSVDRVFALKRE